MTIDSPKKELIPALWELWQEAFGDSMDFIGTFEKTAFSTERCRCVTVNDTLAAALYWFDCSCCEQKVAYIYAVATKKEFQGQGICRELMNNTHRHLKELGFQLAVLVPGSQSLFNFYKKTGYEVCTYIGELSCNTAEKNIVLNSINADEYAELRRAVLPKNSIIQENENLRFLEVQAQFYKGDGFLLSARSENGKVFAAELLGDISSAPEIVNALGCTEGRFRFPGNDRPFSMYKKLTDKVVIKPEYFAFAFD